MTVVSLSQSAVYTDQPLHSNENNIIASIFRFLFPVAP